MKKLIVTNLILLCLIVNAYSQSIPSYVPSNGLAAWFPFNGNYLDASTNGNLLTTVSVPTLSSDRFGLSNSAYRFYPTNNLFKATPITSGQNFTYSLWLKKINSGIECHGIGETNATSTSGGGFNVTFNTPQFICQGVSSNVTNSSTLINDGVWYHYVITKSGSTFSIYINGILNSSGNSTYLPYNATTYLNIGGNPLADCIIDDIGMWNRALTQQEITALYNAQSCTSNTITADGPATFCAGNSVNLTSDVVGGTYQWKRNGINITTNGTAKTYKASSTGSYTCVATCNGTALTSNAIAVTSKTNASASVTANGVTSFCAGDSVTLNCTNLGSNYSVQWYRTNVSIENATAYAQVVKQPGTYKVVTRNLTNGCSRISGSAITTNVNCRTANYSNITTTDDLNDDARFDATELSNGIKIYPNPNNGSFQFKYEGEESGNAQLEVINTMGQIVYQTNVNIEDGFLLKEIMLSDNFQKGIYIVRLLINGSQNDSRVLIQ